MKSRISSVCGALEEGVHAVRDVFDNGMYPFGFKPDSSSQVAQQVWFPDVVLESGAVSGGKSLVMNAPGFKPLVDRVLREGRIAPRVIQFNWDITLQKGKIVENRPGLVVELPANDNGISRIATHLPVSKRILDAHSMHSRIVELSQARREGFDTQEDLYRFAAGIAGFAYIGGEEEASATQITEGELR